MQPVVIIGAARSGTNMLRDMLTALPDVGTWPCDEINYIWRHGNRDFPNDELGPEQASSEVRGYIQRAFDRIARSQNAERVVEKTCANSLRVGFVNAVLPDARFVQIIRDGRDVVASAARRWTAPMDLRYVLHKARYVPPSDLPFYLFRYARNRVHRLSSAERQLATWGPRFEGIEEAVANRSLFEVCALQWKASVARAERDLDRLQEDRVHRVKYEEFVRSPATQLEGLAQFLGVQVGGEAIDRLRTVNESSVGNWQRTLTPEVLETVSPILDETMTALGYF